ncbi:hypothetical protein EZS27_020022 [termite gut metagenome]|uniref:FecR protein domain-containing protein n=1 Tax=termite gut metagenome TaxID=433724 RepID=A0A5J4RC87_9ZZZZ
MVGGVKRRLDLKSMIRQNDINFLQEEDFILWQLTGDSELETHWTSFIENNPHQRDAFEKAIRQFSMIRLNKEMLSKSEYAQLHARIQQSVTRMEKKRLIRRLTPYAAAVCLILVAGVSFFFLTARTEKENEKVQIEHLIVGKNLEEKDIYLVTDAATTSFSKDVSIQIDESGKVIVQEAESGKSTVVEVEKTRMNKLIVPYGKRSQLELSDGTKVWLNSGSVLEFPAFFASKTRNVKLIGEMYAEVSKDAKKPFLVHTPGFQVKVYGTQFNITAYREANTQSVVLVEGSVGVTSESKRETFLTPNHILLYQNNLWEEKTVNVAEYISWKDGYMILNHTPINEVLRRVARYYNLSFNTQDDIDLTTKTCTGKIYLSDNIDDVMTAVSLLSSTKVYARE